MPLDVWACPTHTHALKRLLSILLLAGAALAGPERACAEPGRSVAAAGNTNNLPPSLFAPNVKRVDPSGDGYWLTFTDGKRAYAAPNQTGWRIDHPSRRTVYVERMSGGWRETEAGKSRYWTKSGKGYSGPWYTEARGNDVSTYDKATGRSRYFHKSAGSGSSATN